MDSDKLDAYLRLFEVVNGLGPLCGFSPHLSGKRLSSVTALALGNGEQVGIATTPQQSLTADGVDNAALASDAAPADCNADGPRGAPSARPTRGRKRKPETPDANALAEPVATEPKRAFTINEAARIYSISRSSLYLLIKAGTLPNVTVGGRRLLPRDAMEALIAGKRP